MRNVDGLNRMLNQYHSCLNMLRPAEQQLLEIHLKDLQRALKPGEKRLNWNSLGIQDYIVKCEQVGSRGHSVSRGL